MTQVIITPLEIIESQFAQYELPPEGISILGYLARRMHKTQILKEVGALTAKQLYPHALAQIAEYAAAASATYGKLPYEPKQDNVGAYIMERDPATNAIVMVTLENNTPSNHFSFLTKLPAGDMFIGTKMEEESRFKLRGWQTPTTIDISYTSADEQYHAVLQGVIHQELLPRIVGPSLLRAYGHLSIHDNQGNHGRITLHRNANASVEIYNSYGRTLLVREVIFP